MGQCTSSLAEEIYQETTTGKPTLRSKANTKSISTRSNNRASLCSNSQRRALKPDSRKQLRVSVSLDSIGSSDHSNSARKLCISLELTKDDSSMRSSTHSPHSKRTCCCSNTTNAGASTKKEEGSSRTTKEQTSSQNQPQHHPSNGAVVVEANKDHYKDIHFQVSVHETERPESPKGRQMRKNDYLMISRRSAFRQQQRESPLTRLAASDGALLDAHKGKMKEDASLTRESSWYHLGYGVLDTSTSSLLGSSSASLDVSSLHSTRHQHNAHHVPKDVPVLGMEHLCQPGSSHSNRRESTGSWGGLSACEQAISNSNHSNRRDSTGSWGKMSVHEAMDAKKNQSNPLLVPLVNTLSPPWVPAPPLDLSMNDLSGNTLPTLRCEDDGDDEDETEFDDDDRDQPFAYIRNVQSLMAHSTRSSSRCDDHPNKLPHNHVTTPAASSLQERTVVDDEPAVIPISSLRSYHCSSSSRSILSTLSLPTTLVGRSSSSSYKRLVRNAKLLKSKCTTTGTTTSGRHSVDDDSMNHATHKRTGISRSQHHHRCAFPNTNTKGQSDSCLVKPKKSRKSPTTKPVALVRQPWNPHQLPSF